MNKLYLVLMFTIVMLSCKNESKVEKEIEQIDIKFEIERFDKEFASASSNELPKLKLKYPFLFSKQIPDSIWVNRMSDTLQIELHTEVDKTFTYIDDVYDDINVLFQHLKYYDNVFKTPRVITVTSDVDYRNKTIVTDSIVLISLDTYLGTNHYFYEGIQAYLKKNFDKKQISCDLASNYAFNYIYQSQRKTFLDEMIFYGKQLYFKQVMLPNKTDAQKIGYSDKEYQWAVENESNIWRYFVDKELLYSTDSKLPSRFISPAPFSKFYLELDNESPGELGKVIGWQIVKSYMENNKEDIKTMMQKDAIEIFNNSKYKPKK